MKYTESEYFEQGYRYERAPNAATSKALGAQIRRMLESEEISERGEARRLLELGRQEGRLTPH